uniref:Rootletin-like coiled-coil domain-containing protein n=1 Tax=Strix occidentalis caurina TaxID=311401 RepID=A0A8D0FQZ5_STROC
MYMVLSLWCALYWVSKVGSLLQVLYPSALKELESHGGAACGQQWFRDLIAVSPFPRCEHLANVNTLLREHLDKASEVNSALKKDVEKLTVDWMRAREELELKESEWRSERGVGISYLRGERNRLLSLWRQVVTFRRHFLDMKTATDRDLSELKAEQMRLSGSVLVNCSRLNSGVQLWEPVSLGRPVLKDQAQQQGDLEKKELQDRVTELSALLVQSQKQNEEKEKTMKTLNDTVEILVYVGRNILESLGLRLISTTMLLRLGALQRGAALPCPPFAYSILRKQVC